MKTLNKKTNGLIITIILLLGFIFIPCSFNLSAAGAQEESAADSSISLTDGHGRTVTVPADTEKIIALDAGALRLLCYMGAADRVIAVEDSGHGREKTATDFFALATYRIAYPTLRKLPSIGSKENHEGIIAAGPDLIIASTPDVDVLNRLQKVTGIPVFGVNVDIELDDPDFFCSQLRMLGKVLGKQERADELVSGIDAELADLEIRASKLSKPENAYAGGMMYYGPADLLRTTGDYLPFSLSGTTNVMPSSPAENRQPYMTSLEDLITAAPDFVFIDAANINLSKKGFETNRNVLEEQVPAFKNRQVYSTFVYKYYGTNWENQLINVYYTGKILYPELYSDIKIEDKAEEIWALFFDVPLDFNTVAELQHGGPAAVNWFN